MNIQIEIVRQASDEVVVALQHLLNQLSSSKKNISADRLTEIVSSPSTILILSRDLYEPTKIVGTLTLVLYKAPSAVRARIEDLVVDADSRRKGIGRLMVEWAMEKAKSAGADTIDLTSSPKRVEANQLYKTLGFTVRDTNNYRFRLSEKS